MNYMAFLSWDSLSWSNLIKLGRVSIHTVRNLSSNTKGHIR